MEHLFAIGQPVCVSGRFPMRRSDRSASSSRPKSASSWRVKSAERASSRASAKSQLSDLDNRVNDLMISLMKNGHAERERVQSSNMSLQEAFHADHASLSSQPGCKAKLHAKRPHSARAGARPQPTTLHGTGRGHQPSMRSRPQTARAGSRPYSSNRCPLTEAEVSKLDVCHWVPTHPSQEMSRRVEAPCAAKMLIIDRGEDTRTLAASENPQLDFDAWPHPPSSRVRPVSAPNNRRVGDQQSMRSSRPQTPHHGTANGDRMSSHSIRATRPETPQDVGTKEDPCHTASTSASDNRSSRPPSRTEARPLPNDTYHRCSHPGVDSGAVVPHDDTSSEWSEVSRSTAAGEQIVAPPLWHMQTGPDRALFGRHKKSPKFGDFCFATGSWAHRNQTSGSVQNYKAWGPMWSINDH